MDSLVGAVHTRRTVRTVQPTIPAIIALLGSYNSKIWIFACLFLASGLAMASKTATNYCYVKAKNGSLAVSARHPQRRAGVMASDVSRQAVAMLRLVNAVVSKRGNASHKGGFGTASVYVPRHMWLMWGLYYFFLYIC